MKFINRFLLILTIFSLTNNAHSSDILIEIQKRKEALAIAAGALAFFTFPRKKDMYMNRNEITQYRSTFHPAEVEYYFVPIQKLISTHSNIHLYLLEDLIKRTIASCFSYAFVKKLLS